MQVFKNALWVYAHKISTALITLVSTPIILRNLGVEDYGIYTLTLGLVALFGFINWSLTASTQRFIAVGLVNDNQDDIINTFSTSFFIHLVYGFVLLFLISTLGYFFTESVLDIPRDKIGIAKKVLLFVAFISFFQMIGIPFQGLLKAYENLKIVSLIGILDSLLKLGAAFLLFTAPINKLIFFSILMAISACIIFCSLLIYCRRTYSIASLSVNNFCRVKFKEMMGFTSWNIIGAVAILGRNQGVAVVLNLFFGVIANAAYGVALQIQAALGVFSQGVVAAMTPRILKNAGKNEIDTMMYNAYVTAKYGLFIMSFVCVPLLINMENILQAWLITVPENAVIFSQLIIVFLLCTAFSTGLQTIFHGLNKVKVYNITISLILLLNIPISAFLFYYNYPPYSIFLVSILLEVISFFVRLYLLKTYIYFSPFDYLKRFSKDIILPFIVVIVCVGMMSVFMEFIVLKLIVTSIMSTIFLAFFFYAFSMSSEEKNQINLLLNKILFFK